MRWARASRTGRAWVAVRCTGWAIDAEVLVPSQRHTWLGVVTRDILHYYASERAFLDENPGAEL